MRGSDIVIILILGLGGLYFVEVVYEDFEEDSLSYNTVTMSESSKGNNEEAKMDWMYRDSSQIVDREEYLLGRKVDKQFEKNVFSSDKDRECLPSSIFSNSESQVDVARKLQEDPLYLIKKKEIESREQFLKNPRKMKQLQEMIAKQQAAAEKRKRKEIKRQKKMQLDSLLAKKCKQIFGTVDIKQLEALSSASESSSENGEKESKRDKRFLDQQIATKYKKLLGNIDAKHLAEMGSSSSGSDSNSDHGRLADDQRMRSRLSDFTKSRKKHKEKRANSSKTHAHKSKETNKSSNKKNKNIRDISSSGDEDFIHKDKLYSASKRDLSKNYSDKRHKQNAKYETQAPKRKSRTSERRESSISSDCSSNDSHNYNSEKVKLRSKEEKRTSKLNYEKDHMEYKVEIKKVKLKNSKFKRESSSESRSTSSDHRHSTKKSREKLGSKDKGQSSKVESSVINEKHERYEYKGSKQKSKRSTINQSSSERDGCSSDDICIPKKEQLNKRKVKLREDSFENRDCPSNNDLKSTNKKGKIQKKKAKYKSPSNSESSSEDSMPSKKLHQGKQYGLVLPANYVRKEKPKEENVPKLNMDENKSPVKIEPKRKLTEKEKEQRLKEMMNNAKWREELRDKNIKSHNEKLKSEKDDYIYNEDFMRKQMALAVSEETVESRVKANINSIQRSGSSMNEHFARRH